jgi:predicted nucleotidyltransferase
MSDEIDKIVSTQRKALRRLVERRKVLLKEARHEASRLALRLAAEDSSTRIVLLFGSVASGDVRSEHFDIDLAIDADDYLHLRTLAEESRFDVDLVDLRTVSDRFRDHIWKNGTILYGS